MRVVQLIYSPGTHVSEGFQGDNPSCPTVVQIPYVEGNPCGISNVVVPHHADKQGDHVGCCHDTSSSAEFGHQRCFSRLMEFVIWADAAVPREVESTVQNIGEDVGEKKDGVDPRGESS